MDLVRLNAKVYRNKTGVYTEIPVLLTECGVIDSFVEFFLDHSHIRSRSWMEKHITAIKLFLNFLEVNFQTLNTPKELFKVFVQQLYTGSIGLDGFDPSKLYWKPRKITTANSLINSLTDYFDWISENKNLESINPSIPSSSYEEKLFWGAWHHKHNRSFLAHTWDKNAAQTLSEKTRFSQKARNISSHLDPVKFFPDQYFTQLLFEGFTNYGSEQSLSVFEKLNIRDILITLLLNGGGLRTSEPFHLYLSDVTLDPILYREKHIETALVRIYHPSEGTAPEDWNNTSGKVQRTHRESYLKGKFGLIPRNKVSDRTYRAGWKIRKLDSEKEKFITVQWFPQIYGQLFYKLWKLYLVQIREIEKNHPFAFITLSGETIGLPLSISAYYQNHANAVKKIGLTSAKNNGTSPHGHRHAYGQRLKDANIDPIIRRNALHHASLESQLVYCEPQVEQVSRILNSIEENIASSKASDPNIKVFLENCFNDVDPTELLSGQSWLLKG